MLRFTSLCGIICKKCKSLISSKNANQQRTVCLVRWKLVLVLFIVFLESSVLPVPGGEEFFESDPNFLNYVKHIFPEGAKPPCASPITGLVTG